MGNSHSDESSTSGLQSRDNSRNSSTIKNSFTGRNHNLRPFISLDGNVCSALYSPTLLMGENSKTRCDAAAPPPPPLPTPPPGTKDKASAGGASLPPPPPAPTSSNKDAAVKSGGTNVPRPPASPEDDAIAQAAALSSRYANPGSYEQASMEAKRLVSLDTWEGFRCDVSKQMNPFMMVIHSFGMTPTSAASGGSPMAPPPPPPASYSMVAQVGDENGVFVSRWDGARGSIDGRVQRLLLGGLLMGKLQLSMANSDNDVLLAEVDIGTTIPICTWTANLKYGSMGGGPAWGMNYWQAITPNLTLGGEGMYIAAQGAAVSTYALKYNFQAPLTQQEKEEAAILSSGGAESQAQLPPGMPQPEGPGASCLCANFHSGNGVLTLNYRRVVTPQRVTVGAEMALPVFDPFSSPPEVMLGAEFNLSRSKLQFAVDASTGKFSSVMEAKLGMAPQAPKFGLCATVDHYNQDYKFGYQINIEG